jgi:chromosome segregation ATPase
MIKRAESEAIATADPEQHEDLAQAVAQQQLRQRRDALRDDLLLWRDIVLRVANGQQPTQAMLKELGELGQRLHSAPEALSDAVTALKAERAIDEQLAAAKASLSEVAAKDKQLRQELEDARLKVRLLEGRIMDYQRVARTVPELIRQKQDEHAKAPLMFRPVDVCLDSLMQHDRGMSTEMMKSMQQHEWRLEGHTPKQGVWS